MGQFTNGLQNGQLKSPAVLRGRGEVEERSFLWFRTSSVQSWNAIRAADSGQNSKNSDFETKTLDRAQ